MYRRQVIKDFPLINNHDILGFNNYNQFCVSGNGIDDNDSDGNNGNGRQKYIVKFNIDGTIVGKELIPVSDSIVKMDANGDIYYIKNNLYKHVYDCTGKLMETVSDKISHVEIVLGYQIITVFGNLLLCVKMSPTNVELFTYYDLNQDKFITHKHEYDIGFYICYDNVRKEILHKNSCSDNNTTVYDTNMNKLRTFTIPITYVSCVSNGKIVTGKYCKDVFEVHIFSSHDGKHIFSDISFIPTANYYNIYINNNNGDMVIVDTSKFKTQKDGNTLYTYTNVYAVNVFSLILGLCDSYLTLRHTNDNQITRFFNIVVRLPMEVQMIICHRLADHTLNNITASQVEANFAVMMQE